MISDDIQQQIQQAQLKIQQLLMLIKQLKNKQASVNLYGSIKDPQ